MTINEMKDIVRFIKKNNPSVTLDDLTDEFLFNQILIYNSRKLSEMKCKIISTDKENK